MTKTRTNAKNMFGKCCIIVLLPMFVAGIDNTVDPRDGDRCDGHLEIVSRAEWRAREPARSGPMSMPVSHVIIVHTVTATCDTKPKCIRQLWGMQDYHIDYRGFWDIAYNFLIGMDGRVYVGRGWNRTGSHSINFNTNAIGIAFIGNFNEQEPTPASIKAIRQLLKCGVTLGFLTPSYEVHGHRDVACTESPGHNLYRIIRTWKHYKGGRMPDFNCSEQ